MIVWHRQSFPVGTIIRGIWDYDKIWHDQPALIIRIATAEEFKEYHKSQRGFVGDMKYLDGLYFYETLID